MADLRHKIMYDHTVWIGPTDESPEGVTLAESFLHYLHTYIIII